MTLAQQIDFSDEVEDGVHDQTVGLDAMSKVRPLASR